MWCVNPFVNIVGKVAKVDSKRSSVDTSDFLASESDKEKGETEERKTKKKKLKDLIRSPVKKDSTANPVTKSPSKPVSKVGSKKVKSDGPAEPFTGPPCVKCELVCKDLTHFKNHVLSHYYNDFNQYLPKMKPFPCPGMKINQNKFLIPLQNYFANIFWSPDNNTTHILLMRILSVLKELLTENNDLA